MKRLIMIVLVIVLLIMSGESCVSTNSPIVALRDAYCQWLTMKMVYPTVRITTTGSIGSGVIISHRDTPDGIPFNRIPLGAESTEKTEYKPQMDQLAG